ncbi:hypothetical protein BJV74DRAFT_798516 [Russula compacta]|nr:hypothetical protein BJV74DRAFT_798516 [Russula compacta]
MSANRWVKSKWRALATVRYIRPYRTGLRLSLAGSVANPGIHGCKADALPLQGTRYGPRRSSHRPLLWDERRKPAHPPWLTLTTQIAEEDNEEQKKSPWQFVTAIVHLVAVAVW